MTRRYLVIGAGLAGSATAWELARRGHEVVLMEQEAPAHDGGSSHGSARIFRYAYSDPFYARLVGQARDAWMELEELSGTQLFTATGGLDFGLGRDLDALAGVLLDVGVDHELLTAPAARERWPGIAFDTPVLWHPSAGVVDAWAAVTAMVALARAAGATVVGGRATTIRRRAEGFSVLYGNPDGERELVADHVVVAAGSWLPLLLPDLPLPAPFLTQMPPFEVRQEQVFHFPFTQTDETAWPAFIHKTQSLQTYGLPGGRDAGFTGLKVAQFHGGRTMFSGADSDRIVDPANRVAVTAYVERYFPGLEPTPYSESTCLFTSTPTEDFIIDSTDGITIVSPCSGHGAKFAPLTGRLAADSATGDRPVPRRFGIAAEGRS